MKIPYWIKTGALVFPVVAVVGYLLSLYTEIDSLFWLAVPSIIFEELFESCCYTLSNIETINVLFVFVFWFVIGALVGIILHKIKYFFKPKI